MTKIPFIDDKSKTSKPKALRVDSTRRLLHGLVNQLSVINLLTFKLRSRRGRGESALDNEILISIENAVSQAGEYADALQVLSEKQNRPLTERKARHEAARHLKIVRAGARRYDAGKLNWTVTKR